MAKADTHAGIEITVNINTAISRRAFYFVDGNRFKKAEAIVNYRTENGDFKSAEDLQKVKGIGAATIEKNKSRILL